ncbi:hypothetical protein BGZ83_007698 [Gryganskiella cystojenkinii]|nr:hypothetical protein BGZ83_007698 [Gryganskiella cystojenkinii]
MTLPLEILEEIASYTSGYVCCVLGLDLSTPRVRECMFQSGGPGRVFSEILSRGGDPRALLTIKEYVPSYIAIAKAVVTIDRTMLVRIICMYGTNISDGGLKLALEMDFAYAVDTLEPSLDETIRHRDAYYISKGRYDDVDRTIDDPYGMVYGVGGDSSKLLPTIDEGTQCKLLALYGNTEATLEALEGLELTDRHERILDILRTTSMTMAIVIYTRHKGYDYEFAERLSDIGTLEDLALVQCTYVGKLVQAFMEDSYEHSWRSLTTLICASGFLMRHGMEKKLSELLHRWSHDLTLGDVIHLSRIMDGRIPLESWKTILRPIFREQRGLVDNLILNGCEKVVTYLARCGYDVTTTDVLTVEHVREMVKVHGYGILDKVQQMYPKTVEDSVWIMHQSRYRVNVTESTGASTLGNDYWIPSAIEKNPYVCPQACEGCGFIWNWVDYMDLCLHSTTYVQRS